LARLVAATSAGPLDLNVRAADNLGLQIIGRFRHRDLADLPVAALGAWALGPADDWDLRRRSSRSTSLVNQKGSVANLFAGP
jgi:hypothetical protein